MFDINGDDMIQKDEFRAVVCHLFGIMDSDVILQGDLDRIYLMLDENDELSRDKFEKFYRTLISRTLSDNVAAENLTREGRVDTERSEEGGDIVPRGVDHDEGEASGQECTTM